FYCYGDHRHLHSFPTRRSSDLHLKAFGTVGHLTDRTPGRVLGDAGEGRNTTAEITNLGDGECEVRLSGSVGRVPEIDQPIAVARSEEHTSELQSRSDLVCRLLL